MAEPIFLVCALADSPRVPPGAVFNQNCEACGRKVMVAPSGQRILTTMTGVHIVCGPCYDISKNPNDKLFLAGTSDEIRDEVRHAQPNLRRSRN